MWHGDFQFIACFQEKFIKETMKINGFWQKQKRFAISSVQSQKERKTKTADILSVRSVRRLYVFQKAEGRLKSPVHPVIHTLIERANYVWVHCRQQTGIKIQRIR